MLTDLSARRAPVDGLRRLTPGQDMYRPGSFASSRAGDESLWAHREDQCSHQAPDLHQRLALPISRSNDALALAVSVCFGLGGMGPLGGATDRSPPRDSRQRGPGADGSRTKPSAADQSRISNPASAVVLPRSPRP